MLTDGVSSLFGLLTIITLFIMNSVDEKGIRQSAVISQDAAVAGTGFPDDEGDLDSEIPQAVTSVELTIVSQPQGIISLPQRQPIITVPHMQPVITLSQPTLPKQQPVISLPQSSSNVPQASVIASPIVTIPIPSLSKPSASFSSPFSSPIVESRTTPPSPLKSPTLSQLSAAGSDQMFYFVSPSPLSPSQAFAQFSLTAQTTPMPLPFSLLSFLCSLVQGLKFYILLINAMVIKELKEKLVDPDKRVNLEESPGINSVHFLLPHLGGSLRLLYQLFSSSNLDPSQHVSSASELTNVKSPMLLIGISLNDYICSSGTLYTFVQALATLYVSVLFLQKSNSGSMFFFSFLFKFTE
jgi:hypothetical protein